MYANQAAVGPSGDRASPTSKSVDVDVMSGCTSADDCANDGGGEAKTELRAGVECSAGAADLEQHLQARVFGSGLVD